MNARSINNLPLGQLDELLPSKPKPAVKKSKVASTPSSTTSVRKPATNEANQARLDRSLQAVKARTASIESAKQSAIDERVLQAVLPLWDDENRGVPNPFIRSGLFTVRTGAKREFIEGMEIASLSNYSLKYTGAELQQDDLSVWMSLINLVRNQPMSEAIYFTGYQLVKDLSWRMHSESYKRIQESIERMKVTGVQLGYGDGDSAYSGSLIRDFSWTARDGNGNAKWMVRFEPRISLLFMDDTTTLLEWEVRKKIGTRAAVANWLCAFYSSHRDPIPMPVGKIYQMSRSQDTRKGFVRTLKNALLKLQEVGFLENFKIQDDTVYVQKAKRIRLLK